jgi:hypothetical protein
MTGLLDYLREAKRGLTPDQAQAVDDFVIGILSLHVSDQVWIDTVQMAVRMARKQKP